MRAKDGVGAYGERVAVRALQDQGFEILDRNWRGRYGELDIVARDGEDVVAVEVKTRSSTAFGHPAEAVTPVKLARLRRVVAEWLAEHAVRAPGVRIDVVAVIRRRSGRADVEHVRGVF